MHHWDIGVIGLDFFNKYKCKVDIVNKILLIGSDEVPMLSEGSIGCYRISVGETCSIPPRSEIIIYGDVKIPENDYLLKGVSLVEPEETFTNSDHGLVAKALVDNSKKVPLRIMNLPQDVKIIHSGTFVASMSPVDKVMDSNEQHTYKKGLSPAVKDLLKKMSPEITKKQTEQVEKLLLKHSSLFANNDKELGKTGIVRHGIKTNDRPPVKQPLRRIPVHMKQEVDQHIDDMLERDVIEPSVSPWSAGVVLAKKKDGTTRFCVDYWKLNELTVKDAYPLPRIDDSLDHLSGAQWFSTLDLCSGYWQVELEPEDKPKTAFATKRGLYQFRVMPFGLCNAPATFERLMETVLSGLQWDICLIYHDDIIVIAKSFDEMLQNLETVFNRLSSAGLKLKAKKCHIFAEQVEFLGHIISTEGIATDPKKVEIVKEWKEPSNITEVRSFVGLCSYYRRYIKGFASIVKPLNKLTEKKQKFVWTEDCQAAFETLKSKLTQAPILSFPNFDEPFILDTDASNTAIGAVLSQNIEGQEKVVAYASRALTKSERKYCVTRKELLAVVHFVKYFRHYLYGKRFKVRTDHGSLRWLLNFKNPEGQLARLIEVLSIYDMEIQHRPGTQHKNADALSRHSCGQCRGKEMKETLSAMSDGNETNRQQDVTSKESLKELQQSDKEISTVTQWIKGDINPERSAMSSQGSVVKALWAQRQMLVIENEILYRKWEDQKGTILQAIVPLSERRKVLSYCHDHQTAGHLGIKKTLSKVRQSYYWPGLQRDVRHYVAGCEKCQKSKGPLKKPRAPMQIVGASRPMERIATDILGELPITDKGNRYILVVSDYYTKWTEAFSMPNMEARTVADIIVREVVSRFGVPYIIHSDQGRQYESQLLLEMCKVLHIKKTRTTPYHPQSDGMVERINKTLVRMLKSYINNHQSDWDEHLPFLTMAYRSAEHETTGFSPNYLMLGREVSTPLDIMYEMPSSIRSIPENQWAWALKEKLEEAYSCVRNHVPGAMLRQKSLHDLKLSWQKFNKDDEVYVYFPRYLPGQSPKLTNRWKGPFKILEKCTDVTFKVNCGQRGKPQVIHIDRMRLKRSQRLEHEDLISDGQNNQPESTNDLVKETNTNNDVIIDMEAVSGDWAAENMQRTRSPPYWLSDYITKY